MSVATSPIRTFPWGGQIIKEIQLHKKSANKFYARHGKNTEGREYIEFSKFGPIPNVEEKTYSQKLRLFNPVQWVQLKHYVENELASSIGWDLQIAIQEFEKLQREQAKNRSASDKAKDIQTI
jgi:ERCC4-type nuclease